MSRFPNIYFADVTDLLPEDCLTECTFNAACSQRCCTSVRPHVGINMVHSVCLSSVATSHTPLSSLVGQTEIFYILKMSQRNLSAEFRPHIFAYRRIFAQKPECESHFCYTNTCCCLNPSSRKTGKNSIIQT